MQPHITSKLQEKLSLYRTRYAPTAPGGTGSQDFQSAHENGKIVSLTSQGRPLVLISVTGWVDLSVIVWLQGLNK
jgi:hypothetical protein